MIYHGVKSKSKSLTNKLSTGSALDFLSWSLKFFLSSKYRFFQSSP